MTVVIPRAGHGRRFIEAGYKLPKYLLEAHGKTSLEWSVDSLPVELADVLIFVALREHERDYQIESRIRDLYGHRSSLAFFFLDQVTGGQAETVMKAAEAINPEQPLIIFNIDTMFSSPTLKGNLLRDDVDGVLGSFPSEEPRFSFAATDEAGYATLVTEKEPISKNALTGLYHFRRAGDFMDVASEAIKNNLLMKGEFYVAPLYNTLIERGARFILDPAPVHHILGTPGEYEAFTSLNPAP